MVSIAIEFLLQQQNGHSHMFLRFSYEAAYPIRYLAHLSFARILVFLDGKWFPHPEIFLAHAEGPSAIQCNEYMFHHDLGSLEQKLKGKQWPVLKVC